MLNGNGALDTATHRLLERMRLELEAARGETEAPTQELRTEAQPPEPAAPSEPTG